MLTMAEPEALTQTGLIHSRNVAMAFSELYLALDNHRIGVNDVLSWDFGRLTCEKCIAIENTEEVVAS